MSRVLTPYREQSSKTDTADRVVCVSVCIITWNHERFIAQALDSVFEQRTTFEYEVVIGVDYSTDRTRDIVEAYAARYPDAIRPKFYEERVGLKTNFVETLGRCRGKYVAVLSGDDYWIDPYKLQRQVQFLDNNPDYSLVGDNAIVFSEESATVVRLARTSVVALDVATSELMVHNPFIASTVMFRNIVKEFPAVYFESVGEDRRLYILISQHGKCCCSPNVSGVYRVHSNSITTKRRSSYEGRKSMLLESILNAERWNEYLGGGYQHEVELVREKASRRLVSMALLHLDIRTALEFCAAVDQSKLRSWKSRMAVQCLKVMRRAAIALGWKAATTEELISPYCDLLRCSLPLPSRTCNPTPPTPSAPSTTGRRDG